MGEAQTHFPPHDVGRGIREAGEGPPRHAAEWWSNAPLSYGVAAAHFPASGEEKAS
jgi:hypothetical protein